MSKVAAACLRCLTGPNRRQLATTSRVPAFVHMNAAGAAPVSDETHSAILSHLELERSIGAYAAAARSPNDARGALAELLGCDDEEVALCDSAQAAWARAFYSLEFRQGDRIICWESEYGGNAVAFLQAARRTGVAVEILPMREDGIADMAALERTLTAAPPDAARGRVLVALTHVQTDASIVQPAAAVGALCEAHGALFLLDACQSIGQMAVDVRNLRCDFACGTGRKWLRGPRGTGFLYARRDAFAHVEGGGARSPRREAARAVAAGARYGLVGEPPLLDHYGAQWVAPREYALLPDARRYEMWEASEALRHGLAVAARLCTAQDPATILARASELAQRLRRGLARLDGVTLRDAPPRFDEAEAAALGAGRGAIVCFEAEAGLGVAAPAIRDGLEARGIAVSVSPGGHHFDAATRSRPAAVRLSPSYYNTEAEVDAVLAAIAEVLQEEQSYRQARKHAGPQ